MCGIVGLYLKNSDLFDHIGELFSTMLVCLSSRGPDSAGFALYGNEPPSGYIKVTLRHNGENYNWQTLSDELGQRFNCQPQLQINANYAVIAVRAQEAEIRSELQALDASISVMSVGHSIEILKEIGSPQSIVERFRMRSMQGSHAIGHTRMATESAVTTDGSHPFSTGMDLCLVHNGSLSNHNRLRRILMRDGIEIRTENDSEVAAGYLMWQMQQGKSLQQALEAALEDLDGFYTFAIGTAEGFAVLRDPIACKPAVLAETEDFVAMASEFQALADLPGIDQAKVWEPKPGMVYTWGSAA
ncbi:MAG: glutamine amidotransferase family protein [Candidatus Latescibacterota bacterium]|nr:glutamine amidotransferase family protein [Candidatus Latescibacterota bacterium]MEE2727536.1 glutamine amidotransferase family protein [Candidatus Latescibacterota bacterium]